jgi:hypothetical protein
MRVLTRGDMDGLASLVFLTMVEDIREIFFAHPKDMQDALIEVNDNDIIVNLPYVEGCGIWFDHHISEEGRNEDIKEYKGAFKVSPSTARVIYDHYNKPEFDQFMEMLEAADKVDSGQLSMKDVTAPEGWVLLAFTLDPRTGFGPEFQKYFRWLVEYVKELPVDMVLQHAEVKKRCDRVYAEQEEFKKIISEHSSVDGKVILTDMRGVDMRSIPVGNRFLVYTVYPEANVEIRILKGKTGTTVMAVGHSIFNRTCTVNVGELMAKFGGGGHRGAGTCQVTPDIAEKVLAEIKDTLNA